MAALSVAFGRLTALALRLVDKLNIHITIEGSHFSLPKLTARVIEYIPREQ